MALGIFKKAWNTTQLNDLTNYFSLASYILKLNQNNTESASESVNINGKSGVIEYTKSIDINSTNQYYFTNTSVKEDSVILFSLKYINGAGFPYIQSYSISNSEVTIIIANSSMVNSVDGKLFVNFLIVN
jgi:intein-encoded DNA endonuclease-like protein